jgi:hypothetical protein
VIVASVTNPGRTAGVRHLDSDHSPDPELVVPELVAEPALDAEPALAPVPSTLVTVWSAGSSSSAPAAGPCWSALCALIT